jgi:hypothetical protein
MRLSFDFAATVEINRFNELDSEARGQLVEVLELGVPLVVAEQDEAAAIAHPFFQRFDFTAGDVLGIGCFGGRVGIGDENDVDTSQRFLRDPITDRAKLAFQTLDDATEL